MAKKNYPDSVKGLHYRVSNSYRYLTVSFVLDRNLNYPDLGFNFTETQGQGIVNSSQLCFLTKEDADAFIEKYDIRDSWYGSNSYRAFISRDVNSVLIRIDRGGDIPCYTSKACCDHYSNRTSDEIKARMETEPVLNPFTEADPQMKIASERDQKKRTEGELQTEIINQVIADLGASEIHNRWGSTYYTVPLNLDSKTWVNYDRYDEAVNKIKPSLILSVQSKGSYGKQLNVASTYLCYLPLLPLYKEEMKNRSSWDREKTMSPFWKTLLKAENVEMQSHPIVRVSGDTLGLDIRSYYSSDNYNFTWNPGKRNNAEKIVADIKKMTTDIEAAANAFDQVAQGFDEEDTIE